jgi:hypothetical protein
MIELAILCFMLLQGPTQIPDEIWKISPYNGLGYGFAIASMVGVVYYMRSEKIRAETLLKEVLLENKMLNEQIVKIKGEQSLKVEELFSKLIATEDAFRKETREIFEKNNLRHEHLVASTTESMQTITESFDEISNAIAFIEQELRR